MESREIIGGLFAFFLLLVLPGFLFWATRQQAAETEHLRKPRFWDLIITREDNKFSLSRLQMFLWTVFIVVAFVVAFLHNLVIPLIPPNLYLLMGVNFTTSVLSTAIALRRDMPGSHGKPRFMRDIFFPTGDSLDLPRTQMFIWTIVSLGVFAVLFYESWIAGNPSLPDISSGLVALMGLSNGAYLGVKAAPPSKKTP